MEALFTTTVKDLVENTEKRIAELQKKKEVVRANFLKRIKECTTYEDIDKVVKTYNEYSIDNKLGQYEDNLEYLKACQQDRIVNLNQTEWRTFYHACPPPELC